MGRGLTQRVTFLFLAAAILSVGLFSAAALGGAKRNTTVVVESATVSTGQEKLLQVTGHLNTTKACRRLRNVKLLPTDQTGVVIGHRLTEDATKADGTWNMQGKLPIPPTGSESPFDFFRVKAKKFIGSAPGQPNCKAGLSPVMPIPHPSP